MEFVQLLSRLNILIFIRYKVIKWLLYFLSCIFVLGYVW